MVPCLQVLYKDAVGVFGAGQLQEVVDLMAEKEIRIQIPAEEVDLLLASNPAAADPGRRESDSDPAAADPGQRESGDDGGQVEDEAGTEDVAELDTSVI